MEAISNAVEPYRQSPAYAPIGIILSTIPWFIVMKITEKIPYVDAAHLRKTLLAFLFTGAYVYMWTQGSNPHDAEIKTNTFGEELFLLLAGGYYLIHIQQHSCRHILHDFLYVIFIIAVIIHGEVAVPANTYGFLVEAPNVFLMLSVFIQKLHFMAVTCVLKHLSIIVYFFSNMDICNLGRTILANGQVPIHIIVVFLFLSLFQFLNVIEEVWRLMGGEEVSNILINMGCITRCRTSSNRALCFRLRSRVC